MEIINMPNNFKSDLVELEIYLFYETEKAILVGYDPNDREDVYWLPKSQVEFEEHSTLGSTSKHSIFKSNNKTRSVRSIILTLPEWLAYKEELI